MTRSLAWITTVAGLVALGAAPSVRANIPVLVRRNGAIVNLDTRVETRPGLPPVVLTPAQLNALVARHEAELARRNIDRVLKHHLPSGRRTPR